MGLHFTKDFVSLGIIVEYWWTEYEFSVNNKSALNTSSNPFELAIQQLEG